MLHDYLFFVLNLESIWSHEPNEDLIPLLIRARGNFGHRSNQSFILASHLSIPPAASRTPRNRISDTYNRRGELQDGRCRNGYVISSHTVFSWTLSQSLSVYDTSWYIDRRANGKTADSAAKCKYTDSLSHNSADPGLPYLWIRQTNSTISSIHYTYPPIYSRRRLDRYRYWTEWGSYRGGFAGSFRGVWRCQEP